MTMRLLGARIAVSIGVGMVVSGPSLRAQETVCPRPALMRLQLLVGAWDVDWGHESTVSSLASVKLGRR